MISPIRISIKISAAMLFLGLALTSTAFAFSGDPMSRDVEFRESLAKRDDSRELGGSRSISRFFPRRTDASKKDRSTR